MNTNTNKRIMPLAVLLLVLLVVSGVANFVLYSMWTSAVADNASLEEEVANLELSLSNLESSLSTQVTNLQATVDSLETQVIALKWENEQLKSADLGLIDTYWTDNHPLFGSPYVHVDGTVVNFGRETAYEVVLKVEIYEDAVILKTENIYLENIWGNWYGKFDVDIGYSGDADSVDMSVSYT